jgi:hypothetical protein
LIVWLPDYKLNTKCVAASHISNAQNKSPTPVSLSWFKDSAKVDIIKMYEVKDILAKYDLIVELLTTRKPGYIIYEDEHQVSAVPFKSDLKKVK